MFFKNLKTKTYHLSPITPNLPPITYNLKPSPAFTVMEIIVVVFIIALLTSVTVIGTGSVRSKARDQKRISDIRQMQTALENYFNLENTYPTTWLVGAPLIAPTSGKTLMAKMPSNPTPWVEKTCTSSADYAYSLTSAGNYDIDYCLANNVNNVLAGSYSATPYSTTYVAPVVAACTPNCSGHICGDDGCGGTSCGSCGANATCGADQTYCAQDANTVLLAHFNNNIYDSSNSRTKFGASSGYLNATTGNLSIPDSTDWDLSSGDFTVDTWVYFTTTGHLFGRIKGSASYDGYYVALGTKVLLYTDNNTLRITGSTTLVASTWYHIALVKSGSTITIYLNGVSQGTWNGSLQNYATAFRIGDQIAGAGSGMVGYIDEFRVSKGLARWTANFTPPTSAYTADANTQLLLHMDGSNGSTTFTDSETSAKTVTATNAVQYSGSVLTDVSTSNTATAKFGVGARSFNGSSAYLTVPASTDFDLSDVPNGNNDFTIDTWFYVSTFNAGTIGGVWQGGVSTSRWLIDSFTSTAFEFAYRSNSATQAINCSYSALSTSTWYHLAVVRSGNTLYWFINGVLKGSQAMTLQADKAFQNTGQRLMIGAYAATPGGFWNGYMDEFRISKGVARWTTDFTPPTLEY